MVEKTEYERGRERQMAENEAAMASFFGIAKPAELFRPTPKQVATKAASSSSRSISNGPALLSAREVDDRHRKEKVYVYDSGAESDASQKFRENFKPTKYVVAAISLPRRSVRPATLRASTRATRRVVRYAEVDYADDTYGSSRKRKSSTRRSTGGIRVVGGRIYGTPNGTSCHQCRQKTEDRKAYCSTCKLMYDLSCLFNRYGEDEEIGTDPEWICPVCRDFCNCSNCRSKKGKAPTGILTHSAISRGFNSVSELLGESPRYQGEGRNPAPRRTALVRSRKGKTNNKRRAKWSDEEDSDVLDEDQAEDEVPHSEEDLTSKGWSSSASSTLSSSSRRKAGTRASKRSAVHTSRENIYRDMSESELLGEEEEQEAGDE